MRISKIVHSNVILFLVLVLLMYCPIVMAKESRGHAQRKPSHPKLVHVEGGTFLMGDVLADGDRAMLAETPVHEVELGSFLISPYEVTVGEFRKFVEETGYKTKAETDGQGKATKEMIEKGWTKYPNFKAHWFNQTDQHPAVWIAWEDAIIYCNWLSSQHNLPAAYDESTGQLLDKDGKVTTDVRQVQGIRLPTEAEWEYAAREKGKKVRFGNGKNVAGADEINFDARKAEKKYAVKGEYREATTPVGSFAPNALG
ncbi:MAG: formylglycine-generating enzyme family protein, partial [Planctomycetota bacterium]